MEWRLSGLVTRPDVQQNRAFGVSEKVSAQPKKLYIPPFSSVCLIECQGHFQLAPVPAVRVFYGYGKIKAGEVTGETEDGKTEPMFSFLDPNEEMWAVVQWFRYEDGHEQKGDICYLRASVAETDVRKRMEQMEQMNNQTRQELLDLTECYEATEDDYQYIDDTKPNYQSPPANPNATDEKDVYDARLKVLGDLQPKTVEIMKIYNCTKDPGKRQQLGFELVQSYFAELAHYWTEDEVLAWQRTNPVGTGWMCEFGEVMREPRRQLDPINHELALNWLQEHYNRLSAKDLSNSIFSRVWRWLAPGFKLTADFIKKRRERLGLTTKRPPGPPPKPESQ